MEFIDHTGHVFSLPTFDDKPVALKYKESDYIFWIKDTSVSIDNYYVLPIRFIINVNDIIFYDSQNAKLEDPLLIDISLESTFYKLIGPKYIQEKLEERHQINENIIINFDEAKDHLTINDFYFDADNIDNNLIVTSQNQRYFLFTFYVIGTSKIEGTLLSNIMIKITHYIEKLSNQEKKTTNRNEMYDYLMRETMSNINIYEYNPETQEKTLWTTINTGFDVNTNEIITSDQEEYAYRIRNWGIGGHMRPDVYHYIYNFPQEKWLLKDHYYIFEGEVYESCKYCGSTILVNHDGFGPDYSTYENRDKYISFLKPDGTPYYPENFIYNSLLNRLEPVEEPRFIYGYIPGISETHKNGKGFKFLDTPFLCQYDIRDIFFDISNEKMAKIVQGEPVVIHTFNNVSEYCQITVGGTFIDECEELIINGKNMGINLPKEILKSIYSSSFYNKYADEKIIKNKMKELLLNYMSIKGECGNFKSMINSLNWFGWGDKIEISKLLRTDNEFQNQYILDYFNITTDLKETYKYFNATNLVSLSVKGNNETGEIDNQNFAATLIGEGKPLLEDLFDKVISVNHDDIQFYKPYYDFLFNELALKLDCLAYYYEKYFLPIHIKLNRASIEYKVYANTIKHSSTGFQKIIETPVFTHINSTEVNFNGNDSYNNFNELVFHDVIFCKSKHIIDKNFNEFSNYDENYKNEELYYVNENCISIKINIRDNINNFVKYQYGDYLYIDDQFVRPYKFFTYYEDSLIEVSDVSNATHYQLYYTDQTYKSLDDVDRYLNITEGYFNCKLMLSYIDDNNNEKYLVTNNSFSFYQHAEQYYCNYIIIPRLINDKSFDWLKTKFKLTIIINNKWYTYYFVVKTPNIYLDLGKLEYRYLIGEKTTMFNQIKKMTNDKILFNSFMYQPDLVSIDTLFYNKDTEKIQTFIEKLIEVGRGADTHMYEFYQKYYANKITVPYNKNFYNKVHVFDLYENIEVEDIIYNDLIFNWGGETLPDETWNELPEVIEFNEQHPDAFENGLPNLSVQENISWSLAEEFIYDFDNYDLPIIDNKRGITFHNSKELWDISDSSDVTSIIDHGGFEDGIRCFVTMFLIDLYPIPSWLPRDPSKPQQSYTYIYHAYEVKLYSDSGELIYHTKCRQSPSNLREYVKEQLLYRMWEKIHENSGDLSNNPYRDFGFLNGDPNKILHYFDAIKYESAISNVQKVKFIDNVTDDTENALNIKLIYQKLFDNDGNLLFKINEPIDYDLYLMHDSYDYYSKQEIDEHNSQLDIWTEETIKEIIVEEHYEGEINTKYDSDPNGNIQIINPYDEGDIHAEYDSDNQGNIQIINHNNSIEYGHYLGNGDIQESETTTMSIETDDEDDNEQERRTTISTTEYIEEDSGLKIIRKETIVYYTEEEINDHNSQLDIWEYPKIRQPLTRQPYWYVVFISKYPISNYTENEMTIHNEKIDLDSQYFLKYSGYSIEKFLVNRMDIIPANGMNHFNEDDIIIATVSNNNYQFNIDLSSKWIINHVADESALSIVDSNANIAIISTNNFSGMYSPGYYNIQMNYTINGLNDQMYSISGIYRVNLENQINIYPVIENIVQQPLVISYTDIISDASILYENDRGELKNFKNVIDPDLGWRPIGLKIINAGYFGKHEDIYMGLRLMDPKNPDNGWAEAGSKSGNPYWGFYNYDLEDLKSYNKICYADEEHRRSLITICPQTDDYSKVPCDDDGNPLYPAPNNRAYQHNPELTNTQDINLLNNDDTFNNKLIDNTCAVSDWDGRENTRIIIDNFDVDFDWKTLDEIPNVYDIKFSPAVACCWRYHTAATKQGDWYMPSFAEVFFVTYNFKKFSEKFEELNAKYPNYCKPDLLAAIGTSALWSSTECSSKESWEIHPTRHAHSLSKSTTGWYTIPYIQISKNGNIPNIDDDKSYLTFTTIEEGTFAFSKSGILYSIDECITWNELQENETTPILPPNTNIYWKGNLHPNDQFNGNNNDGIGYFMSTTSFNVSGNISSLINFKKLLLDDEHFIFYKLFANSKVISAKDLILPYDSLVYGCYASMFENCISLIEAPELPATQLANWCYSNMFYKCKSLLKTPELPATQLASYCYNGMFQECTVLTTISNLPATELVDHCYMGMYFECNNLVNMCDLPATILAEHCYDNMFGMCTSLIIDSNMTLPATELMPYCYNRMFVGCSSTEYCPSLPATTLKEGCYKEMFMGCRNIMMAPNLLAETLVDYCYEAMFSECKNLQYIKAMFTTEPSEQYTKNWVYMTYGVGTFVKNTLADWNVIGVNGIPNYWTIEYA